MISFSAISRSSSVLLVGFKSRSFWTSALPKIVWKPNPSNNLQTWDAVFTVNAFLMFAFVLSIFAFGLSMFAFWDIPYKPRICNDRLWSGWSSLSRRFLRNSSKNSVVSWIPFFKSLQFARTRALRKYQAFSAKISFVTSNPSVLRYLIKNTAVVLVFPSPNTWICHSLETNIARWWMISSIERLR